MKKPYFLLGMLLLFASFLFSQEIVSEDEQYVGYQDSMFILQVTTITNQGLDGVNDTTIQYLPPALDTAGLIDLLTSRSMNNLQVAGARASRLYESRRVFNDRNKTEQQLMELGADLDSLVKVRTSSRLVGRYRMVTDSTNYIVEIAEHPNNGSLLRATQVDETTNRMNISVFGQWSFRIRINNEWYYMNWDRSTSSDRRVFRTWNYGIPSQIQSPNTLRLTKLN